MMLSVHPAKKRRPAGHLEFAVYAAAIVEGLGVIAHAFHMPEILSAIALWIVAAGLAARRVAGEFAGGMSWRRLAIVILLSMRLGRASPSPSGVAVRPRPVF